MSSKTRIKILYLTNFHHIGGGETALSYLIKALDKKKFDPIVVLPRKGQLSEKLKEQKVKTRYLKLPPYTIKTFFLPGASPISIYKFLKLVRVAKPDIIHLNHSNLIIYAGLAAKVLGIPLVLTSHGPWDSFYFFQDLLNQIFSDKILANSPLTASSLKKRRIIKFKKIAVVPFGIDLTVFKPGDKQKAKRKLGLPAQSFVISIIGRLDPIKDHLTFLAAADIVRIQIKNVVFFIAGSEKGDFSNTNNSYAKSLKNYLLQNPDLAKKTVFGGFKKRAEEIYHASDLIVSSSISESFPLTLIEASGCQIPVIATNRGGQKLIVKNNNSGFLVPPEKPQALAEKIIILAQNSRLRGKFGKAGRKRILQKYNVKNYAANIENLYLSLAKIY